MNTVQDDPEAGAAVLQALLQRHGGPLCAWGRCAAADCDHFFVDTGRRSPQRFCTPRCATRVRVAAHRAHHATG